MNTEQPIQQAAPAGHLDISPPGCDLFSIDATGGPVLLLNTQANPTRLLGYVHGHCRQLRTLASLAACSTEDEAELRCVLGHVWEGLDQVMAGLDSLVAQLSSAETQRCTRPEA